MEIDTQIHNNSLEIVHLEQKLATLKKERDRLINRKQRNCAHNYERDISSDYGPYERQPLICSKCGIYK